jgi:hypothetical protein
MAKGQMRSNREAKKPKKTDAEKAAAKAGKSPATTFGTTSVKLDQKKR